MWELDSKKGWAPTNWCPWTVVLEKTPESPLDCKEIKSVNLKGDQLITHWKDWCWSWSSSILVIWCKQLTHRKVPDAGKDWGQKKRASEGKMAGWHHWLDGHGFGWSPGVGEGQGNLACCGSWGYKESVTTERLNWTELTRQNFVTKVMSLLFNMLSRFLIAFLSRSKCLLISWF